MNMFLRWSQRKDIYYQQPSMPGFAGGDGNGFIHSIQQNAAWGYTWTVNSSSDSRSASRIYSRSGRKRAA